MLPLNFAYASFILRCLIVLLIVASMTSCARVDGVRSWTPCQHPLIDPSTQQGVERGLLSYMREVDQCNALNGVSPTQKQ